MTDHAVFATTRRGLLAVIFAIQLGLTLPALVAHDHGAAAWAAFGLLAVVFAGVVWWVAADRAVLPAPVAVYGAVVVLTSSVLATAALPVGASFGPADWAFGLIGWYLLLLLVERTKALIAAFIVHIAMSVAWFLRDGTPDAGAAGVVILSGTSFQLGVLAMTRVLVRDARLATEAAAEHEAARTREVLARQREQDLRVGFEGQLGAVLPLLADLADEVTSVADETTRLRCSVAAVQLRRLFAENDDVPDPLLHELMACVDVAERRGVVVSLAVSGTATPVPTRVRRELVAPMARALAVAEGRAKVSLLRTPADVRVAVVTDALRPALDLGPDSGSEPVLVSVETSVHGGLMRSEARWRTT